MGRPQHESRAEPPTPAHPLHSSLAPLPCVPGWGQQGNKATGQSWRAQMALYGPVLSLRLFQMAGLSWRPPLGLGSPLWEHSPPGGQPLQDPSSPGPGLPGVPVGEVLPTSQLGGWEASEQEPWAAPPSRDKGGLEPTQLSRSQKLLVQTHAEQLQVRAPTPTSPSGPAQPAAHPDPGEDWKSRWAPCCWQVCMHDIWNREPTKERTHRASPRQRPTAMSCAPLPGRTLRSA